MSGALVVRGDARRIPMPDESVDLIVTSPPYFALRSYRDDDGHYDGQIGSEPTTDEFLEALWAFTAECWRVLGRRGSLFVNLGDKYAERAGPPRRANLDFDGSVRRQADRPYRGRRSVRVKSLHGLPWRYVLGCIDGDADPEGKGWILRAEMIWQKPNGLPESVEDRVRRSHEQWFHLVKSARYYSAIDELREQHVSADRPGTRSSYAPGSASNMANGAHEPKSDAGLPLNALGKIPGSVWSVASEPIAFPDYFVDDPASGWQALDAASTWQLARLRLEEGLPLPVRQIEHFAAFPSEWPRRLVLGWSPPGVCTVCGEGRRPVVDVEQEARRSPHARTRPGNGDRMDAEVSGWNTPAYPTTASVATIIGHACSCCPHTDHPENRRPTSTPKRDDLTHRPAPDHKGSNSLPQPGPPVREWHLDRWDPPPTRPAVVLDPFGGTGTTAMVARALGRRAVSLDLSLDYCRLSRWRIFTSGGAARARERTNRERQGALNL